MKNTPLTKLVSETKRDSFSTKKMATFKKESSSRGKFSIFKLLSLFALVMFGVNVLGQNTSNFNDGYITVFKNASISTSKGSAIVLEEYLPSATSATSPNFSVNLPNNAAAGSNGIVSGGTTSSNGAISRSENGRYILVPGWSTNSTISTAAIGAANTTFTICAVRPVNGLGTVGTGITGTSNWFTSNNDYRGATSDDGTNYWVTGGSLGLRTTTNGTTLTTVSSTSTNIRVVNIINGQLYYSTGSGTNGVYKVGSGKPTAISTTSVNLTTSTGAYGFAISPDNLTLYANSAAGVISRWTYNSGTSSWGTASTGLSLGTATGLVVDWSSYTFSLTGTNGAVIYASNTPISGNSTIVRANDNGVLSMSGTVIASVAVSSNIFKQIAFSPIKQSINIGANTPATGNINKGGADTVLFQMNLSADEGNSTVKKIVLATAGTAVLGTDISNFRIVDDANNDGAASAAEIAASFTTTGTVSGSNITFSGLLLSSYITQGNSKNFLILGDVAAGATASRTFIPSIASNNTINSITYTSNITNAGGSLVTMGTLTNAPLGNTLTIVAPSTSNVTLATTGTPSSANLGTGTGKLIYGFALTPSGGSVDFTALNITTAGTTTSSDISTFDLYLDADNSGTINSGDTLVKTVATLSNPLSFTSFTNAQTGLSDGTTYKYLIQATVAGSATNGRTITLSIAATSDITTNVTGSVSGTPAGNTMYVGSPSTTTDNSGTPSASNLTKAATDIVVFGFKLTPTGLASFSDLNIATAGTATNSDISNFRIYKDANSNGIYDNGTDVLLQTVSTLSSTLTFSSLAQTGLTSATNYLLLVDIASGATTGRTFTASIAASGDITLGSGSNTGTAAGNQMTIDVGVYGDFRSNGTGGGVWSAAATWQTLSATGTWVSASVTPTSISYAGKNVTIQSGDEVTVTGTSNYCKNLTIQGSGGKLFANSLITTFINVFGDITCDGTIGNGATYDAIGFDVEGATCTISGSGSFDASRIAKNSITSPASIATTLYFDMNANLRYGGTAAGSQSSNNTVIYVNTAGAILNIVINQNKTVTCYGDGTATSAAAISIDGVDGTGSGERGGTLTVNGTLDIQYNGTPAGTTPSYGLHLVTNNATSTVSVSIGSTGTINTPRIVCSASGVAGHTFSIASGGVLNITQEPTSFVTPSTTNNTYSFNANSNINYTKTGNQTLYTFGASVYQGNITFSGSGVKSVPSIGILNVAGTLTTAGLLTLKSDTNGTASIGVLTTGTITGNATVERYIPARRAWRALTAPLKGSDTSVFSQWQNNGIGTDTTIGVELWGPGGTGGGSTGNGLEVGPNNSILRYVSGAWNPVTNTKTMNLFTENANNAFFVFSTGGYRSGLISSASTPVASDTTLKATGQLITGQVDFLSLPSASHTLIGNPYASPISPYSILTGNPSFGSNLWIWDARAAGTYGVGAYNSYEKVANKYTNVTNSVEFGTTPDIQSGQAFFVIASSVPSTLTILEDFKSSAAANNIFLRNAAPAEVLRVGLYKQINNEWSGRDGAMTVFFADAQANQIPNKMANGSENVAFTKNGTLFASEHHLPLVASDVLNVKVWNTTAGANYKLKINTEQFNTTNLNATLEDLFTNSRTSIALEGTAVEYPFSVTTEAASTGNRFRIVFENSALGINNPKASGISILPNPITGDTFQVNLGTLSTGTYSYSISNALGQEVEKGNINNVTQNSNYTVKFKNSTANGMYIMKVTGTDNSVFTAKIIKQ